MNDHTSMIEMLSELLEEGETLIHPIFGYLNEDGVLRAGFFGLTETHLLVVLISKAGSHGERLPLKDIRYVYIKQSGILKKYTINITPCNHSSMQILASPTCKKVRCQGLELPQFITELKKRVKKETLPALSERPGKKIRVQYFNILAWLMLPWFPALLILLYFAMPLQFGETLRIASVTFAILLLPLAIFSYFNTWLFGKTLCVLDDNGIHLENDLLPWGEIAEIVYCPQMPSRHSTFHKNPTHAIVFIGHTSDTDKFVKIPHFPLYGLMAIKKQMPEIPIRIKKGEMIFYALLPSILALIVSIIRF